MNETDGGPPGAGEADSGDLRAAADLELLKRWGGGCKQSGALLFERHSPALARFFRNKGGEVAEDLIQSTFLACLEEPGRFEQRSSFRTYLLSIARFKLYAHYRSGGVRRRAAVVNTTSVYYRGPSPSSVAVRRDEDTNLLRALRTIPVEQQILLELAYWEDLSGSELAEVLEVPVSTVYTRIHRAKQSLRQALQMLEPTTI